MSDSRAGLGHISFVASFILGVIFLHGSRAAAQQPSAPPPPAPAPQKVGGVTFTVMNLNREGQTYTLELSAEADGRDIRAGATADHSTVIVPSGATVRANYVQLGDVSGVQANAIFLAGYKPKMTVKWTLPDSSLNELPRVSVKIYLDNTEYELKYSNLKPR